MPRNDAAAPGHDCSGIRIHAIDIDQPPGIGIPPIADMDAHQPIVAAALAAKSSAETPKKARSEVRSEAMRREIHLSEFTPIEVLNFQCRHIHTVKATDIDGRRFLPGWGGTFAKRMNAACRAKTMFYDVLVERISAHLFRRREQCHCLPRNEPHQRAFALAYGTVA